MSVWKDVKEIRELWLRLLQKREMYDFLKGSYAQYLFEQAMGLEPDPSDISEVQYHISKVYEDVQALRYDFMVSLKNFREKHPRCMWVLGLMQIGNEKGAW